MLLSQKHTIFFSEEFINLDTCRIRKIAKAAQRLLPSTPGYHIFIKMDSRIYNCFIITHGSKPNIPLDIWQAILVNDGEQSQIKWLDIKK